MNLILNYSAIVARGIAESPYRLGVLVHMVALASPLGGPVQTPKGMMDMGPYRIVVNPLSLAQRVRDSRAKVVSAIGELEAAGLLTTDKKKLGIAGVWVVDLTPCKDLFVDGERATPLVEIPLGRLRSRWEGAHVRVIGSNWVSTTPVQETKLWPKLYETHGDALFGAIDRYFDESDWSRWSPSVFGFAKTLTRWISNSKNKGGLWS